MSVTTFTSTALATLPRVNLLPPEIAEEARLKRIKIGLAAAVAGCAAVVGVMYMSAAGSVDSAQGRLDTATSQRTQLEKDITSLNNVALVYATVAQRENLLVQAMGQEVRWSRFLNDLALTIPSDVWMTDVRFKQELTTAVGANRAGTPPISDPGIGTVTFSGQAMAHNDVARWLEVLAKQKGYGNPYFSRSSVAEVYGVEVYQFTSTVTVTPTAKSGRYAKPAGS